MKCNLCGNSTEIFEKTKDKTYFSCSKCRAIMLDNKNYLSPEEEKKRYESHNNDVEDKRYQNFVYPIVREVLDNYKPSHKGLDFGAGTGPVITKLLQDKDYNIKIYDPYFANRPKKLEEKYDYIACCEVVEHFYKPKVEFKLLKSLLNSGGSLYIKTSLYSEDIDFKNWYYKSDPTHVFFYREETLEWIRENFGFKDLIIKENMIILKV